MQPTIKTTTTQTTFKKTEEHVCKNILDKTKKTKI